MNATLGNLEEMPLFRTLLDSLQDGLVLIQDGRIAFANVPSARMLGYKVADLTGHDIAGFVAAEDRERVVDNYRRRMAGEDVPTAYAVKLRRKDGGACVVHVIVNRCEDG
ncbi:MAG: PAS domain S-box protein, partial [Rhodospirillales bacterium]|nr:PAS domain S-box protein [Rhodospirillales bacterium]